MKARPSVLLVEANETKETLERRIVAESGVNCELHVARDGMQACRGLFAGCGPLPALILLGLDIPKLDGFQILTLIRTTDATRRLPVVVLSDSGKQEEIDRCLDLHANSYVNRDQDLDCFGTRLKLILYYWIAVNQSVGA